MELMDIFKRVELFRGLTVAQLQRLAAISERETYHRQQVICKQGDMGDRMYIVADGQVEIQVRDAKGQTRSTVYLGEGQVVGEITLLDEGTRSATVLAVADDTVVFGIPNHNFVALCKEDTAIGYVMMRNLAQDLSFKLRHVDHTSSAP